MQLQPLRLSMTATVLGTSRSEVYEVIPHFTFGFVLGCGVV